MIHGTRDVRHSVRCRTARRLALVLAPLLIACGETAAGELRRNGPWLSTERLNNITHRQEHMAATPAAENRDVWLLLVCDDSRITASLMHSNEFPPGVSSNLVLRSDGFPAVAVPVRLVRKNQLSIDAATTRHLMPLILDSKRLVISMSAVVGNPHDYTFSLQPNDLALAEINRRCASAEPLRQPN
jgi:hypothetical protein